MTYNHLEQLKQNHKDLDKMIQELHNHHYSDDYIEPYKIRKLTIKEEIANIESNHKRQKEYLT
jgi:hypothetical protein